MDQPEPRLDPKAGPSEFLMLAIETYQMGVNFEDFEEGDLVHPWIPGTLRLNLKLSLLNSGLISWGGGLASMLFSWAFS